MAPDPIPPILYKYYPPERLDEVFNNFSIRFSPPGEFNDVFDANWPVKGASETLVRYKFRNKIGIFCLSATPHNHLMWVHYAKNHKGFVVGFKSNAEFLTRSGNALRKVKYQPLPDEVARTSVEGCFYKQKDWSYEEEWRCVREISKFLPRDDVFDLRDIAEVVLGQAMTPSDINAILELVGVVNSQGDHKIRLRMAKANFISEKIEAPDSDLVICEGCRGKGHIHRAP